MSHRGIADSIGERGGWQELMGDTSVDLSFETLRNGTIYGAVFFWV